MIIGHKYIIENNKKVLVLKLDYNQELAGKRKKSFKEEIINYIKNNKLIITSGIIILAVGNIAIAKIHLDTNDLKTKHNFITDKIIVELTDYEIKNNQENSNEEIKEETLPPQTNNNNSIPQDNLPTITPPTIEPPKEENNQTIEKPTINNSNLITIYRTNGQVLTLELEEYIIGVVAAEMPASFHIEALKAQAIVARTYTLKRLKEGKTLTDDVNTQSYIDINQMKAKWNNEFDYYYQKIKSATESTKGQAIYYNGNYIDAVYHSTNNGYTLDSVEVWQNNIPYLKSVESPWDLESRYYNQTTQKDINTILNIFNQKDPTIEIIERNQNGYVKYIKVGNIIVTGKEFRTKLSLASTDFNIIRNDQTLTINTKG